MLVKISKTKKIILIILGSVLVSSGIFYGGKKFGESRYKQQIKAELETKIAAKENEITSLKAQLKKETNSAKKQELEQKVRDLEQQLTQLKNFYNPTPSSPTPPTPQNPPTPQPGPKTELEIKWGGGSSKQGYRMFLSADWPQTRIKYFIAENHSAIKGKKFDHKITPKIKVSFSSTKTGNEIVFEESDSDFTLTPLGNWPDETNPVPQPVPNPTSKTEKKVRFISITFGGDALFDNFVIPGMLASKWEKFRINSNHPLIKLLKQENGLVKDKKFIIKYGVLDGYEDSSSTFIFSQNNSELELHQLD